jgi:DNA polymerase-3 subunit chi
VAEFRFHHLERRRIDQALPELLEAALAEGLRVVVQTGSPEQTDALNDRLWTYADSSFLPHGSARDGDPEAQPIYLTDQEDNPNGAQLRVALPGVDATRFAGAGYSRVLLLFDGRDEDAKAEARRQWTRIKAAGEPLGYWREGDDGGWEKAR